MMSGLRSVLFVEKVSWGDSNFRADGLNSLTKESSNHNNSNYYY